MSDPRSVEAPVSRVIEYLPPGYTTTGKDCIYHGGAFSKGATVSSESGTVMECSGDKEGTWVKKSPK